MLRERCLQVRRLGGKQPAKASKSRFNSVAECARLILEHLLRFLNEEWVREACVQAPCEVK